MKKCPRTITTAKKQLRAFMKGETGCQYNFVITDLTQSRSVCRKAHHLKMGARENNDRMPVRNDSCVAFIQLGGFIVLGGRSSTLRVGRIAKQITLHRLISLNRLCLQM